jgi:hypothetical protein
LQVGVFMSVIAVSGLAVSTLGRAGLGFRQQATPSSSLRLDDRASGAYSKVEDEACRRPTETNRLQGRGRSASAL